MKARITSFDYLRTLCAIAVVAIHSFDTNPWLHQISETYLKFAVPVFLMMSFYLMANRFYQQQDKPTALPPAQYLQKRILRLLPPFFVWTAVYVFIRSFISGHFELNWQSLLAAVLIGSASMQLYYIPLLIYFSLLLLPLGLLAARQQHSTFLFCFLGVAVTFAFVPQMGIANSFPSQILSNFFSDAKAALFISYFKYNFPYALLGIFFFYTRTALLNSSLGSELSPALYSQKTVKIIQLAALFILVSVAWKLSGTIRLFAYIRDISVFAACFFFKAQQKGLAQQIAKFSFGIYLVHPLFIEGFQKIEHAIGLSLDSFMITTANFGIGLAASLVASLLLYKSSKTRFLVA